MDVGNADRRAGSTVCTADTGASGAAARGLACAGGAGGAVGHRHLRFRYQLRRWTAKWVAGGSFEIQDQYSLESLSQPAALLSGETVLWYNSRFRTALLGGEDRLAGRAQKLLPGLDTTPWRAVPFLCLGVGCGLFGGGTGELLAVQAMKKHPELQKQNEIAERDERNVAIGNAAKPRGTT